jgi:hypothetical protein
VELLLTERSGSREPVKPRRRPSSPRPPKRRLESGDQQPGPVTLSPEQAALEEKLRAWRLAEARKRPSASSAIGPYAPSCRRARPLPTTCSQSRGSDPRKLRSSGKASSKSAAQAHPHPREIMTSEKRRGRIEPEFIS